MAGFKFPDPKRRSMQHPAVTCDADRILSLYNQDSGAQAKRVSKSVKEWFQKEAHEKGWAGVGFLPNATTGIGYSAILWVPTTNTPTIFVIEDGAGADQT